MRALVAIGARLVRRSLPVGWCPFSLAEPAGVERVAHVGADRRPRGAPLVRAAGCRPRGAPLVPAAGCRRSGRAARERLPGARALPPSPWRPAAPASPRRLPHPGACLTPAVVAIGVFLVR